MGDESVDLGESAGIEKQFEPLTRSELASFPLGVYPLLPAAKVGLLPPFRELGALVARLLNIRVNWSFWRTGVGRISRDCSILRVIPGGSVGAIRARCAPERAP